MVSMACLSFFASPSNNAISLGSVFTRNLLLIPELKRSNPWSPDFNRRIQLRKIANSGPGKKITNFFKSRGYLFLIRVLILKSFDNKTKRNNEKAPVCIRCSRFRCL